MWIKWESHREGVSGIRNAAKDRRRGVCVDAFGDIMHVGDPPADQQHLWLQAIQHPHSFRLQ